MTRSATGIVRQGNCIRSVTLRRGSHEIELLDYQTIPTDEPAVLATGADMIVGMSSDAVAFHRTIVPAVKDEELAAVIRMQAEAVTPLPIEDMTLAWHAGPQTDGQRPVTIATAHTDHLRTQMRRLEHLRPQRFILEGQALVKAWRMLCPQAQDPAVLITFTPTGALLCLAEPDRPQSRTHQLINQTALDITLDDLDEENPAFQANRRRFVVDLIGAIKLFGFSTQQTPVVFILGLPTPTVDAIADALADRSLDVKIVTAMPADLAFTNGFSQADLFDYLIPLGLALIGLDEDVAGLDLFTELSQPEQQEDKAAQTRSLKKKAAIVAALLALWILASYLGDIVQLHRLEKAWPQDDAKLGAVELLEQHQLRKNIAAQRIDLLELFTRINAARPEGVLIDRFTFKRGRPVSVIAGTKQDEKLYDFQKALAEQKGIRTVTKHSPTRDEKKGLTATFSFDYKHFTAKRGSK